MRFFFPNLPEFSAFFAAYAEHEGQVGRDRRVASRFEQALASSSIWKPGETLQLLIPSTVAGNLDLFTRIYIMLMDLVEEVGELPYDFGVVREAWRMWSKGQMRMPKSGSNLIRIERI